MVQRFARCRSVQEFRDIEADLRAMLERLDPNIARDLRDTFHNSSTRSAAELTELIDPRWKNSGVRGLDYGAGDGYVGRKIADGLGVTMEGADIMPPEHTEIPVKRILPNGNLDWANNHFAISIIVKLLHHIETFGQQEGLIDELRRVTSDQLYVVETPISAHSDNRPLVLTSDYFSNRMLRPIAHGTPDIPVPGTFRTPAEWEKVFVAHELSVKYSHVSQGKDRRNMSVPHCHFVLGKI